jgi:hypothetical protein
MADSDLFGAPVDTGTIEAGKLRSLTNDMDAVITVLTRASGENKYLISQRGVRLFRRVDRERMRPVPRWEADLVTQLIDSGHLRLGGSHVLRCGAVRSPVASVLASKATRDQLARWRAMKPMHAENLPTEGARQTEWRKDPLRHLDIVPTNADPDTCKHNGGKYTHREGNILITQCTECNSTWSQRIR